MILDKMHKQKYTMGLLALIAFHLLNIFFWLNLKGWPVGKDWYLHLNNTFRMMSNLAGEFSLRNLTFVDIGYPPFYYWIAMLLVKLSFGINRCAFLTSAVFLVVLLLSTYGVGKKLRNKQTGFLAAVICSFFPIIYSTAIEFNFDLAATAMVGLIVYTLLASDGFRKRHYAFFLGLSLGLGLLIRQFIFLFVIGPILAVLCKSLGPQNKGSRFLYRQKATNIIIFILVSFCTAFIFYHNLGVFKSAIGRMNITGEVASVNIFSWPHLTFYVRALPQQIGLLGTVFFAGGLCRLLNARNQERLILMSWIIIPFFVLTFIFLKFTHYTTANLPAIALIIAIGIDKIKKETLKTGTTMLLIVIMMCQYFKGF